LSALESNSLTTATSTTEAPLSASDARSASAVLSLTSPVVPLHRSCVARSLRCWVWLAARTDYRQRRRGHCRACMGVSLWLLIKVYPAGDLRRPALVGAENSVTSCDLHVLVHEAGEPVSSQRSDGECGGRGSAACGAGPTPPSGPARRPLQRLSKDRTSTPPTPARVRRVSGTTGLFAPDPRDDTVRRCSTPTPREPTPDGPQRRTRPWPTPSSGCAACTTRSTPASTASPWSSRSIGGQQELEVAQFERQRVPSYISEALQRAEPVKLEDLYQSMGREMIYHPAERLVELTVRPRVASERVRGGLAH
jgi:hypothetical protein